MHSHKLHSQEATTLSTVSEMAILHNRLVCIWLETGYKHIGQVSYLQTALSVVYDHLTFNHLAHYDFLLLLPLFHLIRFLLTSSLIT